MKKNFMIFCLLFSLISFSQNEQIVTMHAVLIEGDLKAFEEVETMYMQKVAQKATERGDISAWNFLKALQFDSLNDESNFNYLFVQGNSSIEKTLDPKNSWWNLASEVLSLDEQKRIEELRSKFTWKKDVKVMYTIDTGIWLVDSLDDYQNTFIQFNFAKPKNSELFIKENKELWQPFFEEIASDINLISWGVGTKIHPTGEEWSNVMTWDMFKSLTDLFKFRLGENIVWPVEKSNMSEINPEGFSTVAVWQWITGAASN